MKVKDCQQYTGEFKGAQGKDAYLYEVSRFRPGYAPSARGILRTDPQQMEDTGRLTG